MTILASIIPAPGYWLLSRPDGDGTPWRRDRLVAWGLVDDGAGVPPYVAGLVLDAGAEVVVVAPPGRYVHEEEWQPCGCETPNALAVDAAWCRYCGGTVPR